MPLKARSGRRLLRNLEGKASIAPMFNAGKGIKLLNIDT